MTWACIARFGGVGDNLIASAVLPGLRAKYGRVEVITQHPQHVTFENNPFVDKLSVHQKDDLPEGADWQKWFVTRGKETAFFANLSHSLETLRALLPGQTQFYWSAEFRRKFCGQSYLETVADICGVPYDTLAPGFFPTDEEHAQAEAFKAKLGGRVIGWVLAGTRIDKVYPWSPDVVERLVRDVAPVVMLGMPNEKQLKIAETITGQVQRGNGTTDGLALGVSPSWPLRRVLTMAQHCDLVIGPDTGPMWAVAACAMPKIMLLSHASPENITKYWRNTTTLHADPARVNCFPCHRLHDTPEFCRVNAEGNAAACISDISVSRLMTAVAQAWSTLDVRDRPRPTPQVIPRDGGAARPRPHARRKSAHAANGTGGAPYSAP